MNKNLNFSFSATGLIFAWTGELEFFSDNLFIWELINSNEDILNIPILVCEEDCNFDCIVIMIKLKKTKDYIYWLNIGVLDNSNYSFIDEALSGILNLESYTDEDWEKYGDNIALCEYDTKEYWDWVSQNWNEESLRRRRNYIKPYMQNENNIKWLKDINWKFDTFNYNNVIKKIKKEFNKNIERR